MRYLTLTIIISVSCTQFWAADILEKKNIQFYELKDLADDNWQTVKTFKDVTNIYAYGESPRSYETRPAEERAHFIAIYSEYYGKFDSDFYRNMQKILIPQQYYFGVNEIQECFRVLPKIKQKTKNSEHYKTIVSRCGMAQLSIYKLKNSYSLSIQQAVDSAQASGSPKWLRYESLADSICPVS